MVFSSESYNFTGGKDKKNTHFKVMRTKKPDTKNSIQL